MGLNNVESLKHYLTIINTEQPIAILPGGINNIKQYVDGFLYITPKNPNLINSSPLERLTVPGLVGLSDIRWLNYIEQKEIAERCIENEIYTARIPYATKEFMIRQFIPGQTLRERLFENDCSSVQKWISEIMRMHTLNLFIGDRITTNEIINDNNVYLIDFDTSVKDIDFTLAQAFFYSWWLSTNHIELEKITTDSLSAAAPKYDLRRVKQYAFNYIENVVNPNKPDSIFNRIETHPLLSSDIEKERQRQQIKKTLLKILD